MKQDAIKLFTTIKPFILRRSLIKGTMIATFGIMILVISGSFIPPHLLAYLGPFIILLGGGLITLGLLPYRRLNKLENSPNEIIYVYRKYLQYIVKGVEVFTIPFEKIEKIDYLESGNTYGIAIYLKKESPKKIIVHNSSFDMSKYQIKSYKNYHCDIYIPYFSRRSFNSAFDSST